MTCRAEPEREGQVRVKLGRSGRSSYGSSVVGEGLRSHPGVACSNKYRLVAL